LNPIYDTTQSLKLRIHTHDTILETSTILEAAMATELPTTNGHSSAQDGENNFAVKAGLARMLKGGVIMDVINAEQVSPVLLALCSFSFVCRAMPDNITRPA
jgi:hypothetical protein